MRPRSIRGWIASIAAVLCVLASLLASSSATAASPPPVVNKTLLLLHGYQPLGGVDCTAEDMWAPTIRVFESQGWAASQIHTMGYYNTDTHCRDQFDHVNNMASIESISRVLAWYIYNNQSTWAPNGQYISVVAHSMGGLLIRNAILGTRTHAKDFPPGDIRVDSVVSLGTPYHGTTALTTIGCDAQAQAFPYDQCKSMEAGSSYLAQLRRIPVDTHNTVWAAIGTDDDGVAGGDSAVYFPEADTRVKYAGDQGLGHSELHEDHGELGWKGWSSRNHSPMSLGGNMRGALYEAFDDAKRNAVPPPSPPTSDCHAYGTASSVVAEASISTACAQVAAGTWYSWGGGHGGSPGPSYGYVDPSDPERSKNDPSRKGLDCSGLVRWAWSQAVGYDVMGNTTAAGQFSLPGQRLGTDISALLPGDIVFWGIGNPHHVAIYLGAGKIVEARESDTHLMVSDMSSHDMSAYAGGLRFMANGTGGTGDHVTWGTSVNVRSAASRSASLITNFPGPTAIHVDCQKHAESVTAEGVTNDAWAHLPDYNGWVSNIYIKGGYWLDGVPDCGGTTTGSGEHSTWGTSVNVRSQPARSGSIVTNFSAPTAIHIDCQKHAESVTAEGTTNDAWSHLPDLNGWVTNIYVKGAAWLDGVPDCGGGTSTGSYSTWGTDVNLHAHPATGSDIKSTLSGPTQVKIGCQKHAQSVTAEGTTNDAWSYLPDYSAWISNIYLKGSAWMDGVIDCTIPPALDPDTGSGSGTSAGADGMWSTWGTNVNLHSHPNTGTSTVSTLAGPTTARIGCQKHAQSVTAEGTTNDAWSYLPDYKAWVSNIYIKGGAWLDNVIDCTIPPALDPETQI